MSGLADTSSMNASETDTPLAFDGKSKENAIDTPKTNGHETKATEEEGPPSKKRKVSEVAPKLNRVKVESPPWKTSIAEGPSTFTIDGKRKSGRTNQLPLELQSPTGKRQTRGALQNTYSGKGKGFKALGGETSSPVAVNGSKRPQSSNSQAPPKSTNKTESSSVKRSHKKKSSVSEEVATPVRSHKKKLPNPHSAPAISTAPPRGRPVGSRRSGRVYEAAQQEAVPSHELATSNTSRQSPKSLPRIRFKVKPAELPFPHYGLVIHRPQRYASLREFLEKSATIPVEEGGLYSVEDTVDYTPEGIARDAQTLVRLEDAALPGGLLSKEKCSAYQPEEQEQPPRQYSHQDHLNRAAFEFLKLMNQEQRKHKLNAKRLAEACRDVWYKRQPKSAEQLEADEIKASQIRYKTVMKILQATWDNVRIEINRRRLLEWEVQEQARVRKALNEAVDISTQKLEARRNRADLTDSSSVDDDSDREVDEDQEEDVNASGSEPAESEDNMSSSDSEAEEEGPSQPDILDDENLSVEQLQKKYAALPDLPVTESVVEDMQDENGVIEMNETADIIDDSDESVDMDDDMGSSDEDRDSDEEDGSEDDEDDEEEEGVTSNLLGFLAPAEVEAMNTEHLVSELTPTEDAMEVDEDPGNLETPPLDSEIEAASNTIEPLDDEKVEKEAVSNSTEPFDAEKEAVPNSIGPLDAEILHPVPDITTTSPDRSSQPTPITVETRPSDADSVSSVDGRQTNGQLTQDATPQPDNGLTTSIPSLLRGTLREYQHYGLDWLAGLYANNTNGILADEMGLGKTIQTISLLAHLACFHEVWGPHLIIVPTSVMLNWEMEFKKFCPGFKILTYYGTQEERKRKRVGWKRDEDKWNVIITSYQLVLQDQAVFKRRRWHYMILDEAHNIKNFQSQRWQAMLTFNTRARLLLTGTPLQNNLTELWSLLYFLMPSDGTEQGVGGFANLKEFQDWFKKPSEQILEHGREQMDDESRAIISKLHKVLRPYLLRRLKADVEKQMPAKYEHVELCRLSKRQRELYDGFLNRDDTRGTLASGNYLSIINCLMQLRKVCNHPDLFIERAITTSFPMEKSVVADYEIKDLLIRRRLLQEDPMESVSVDFLNLVPTNHEWLSDYATTRVSYLNAQKPLMDLREAQRTRAQNAFTNLNPSTAKSNLLYLESASRWSRFEELQHCVYLNALRKQQKPIYGSRLVELLTLGVQERPLKPRPTRRNQLMLWLENSSTILRDMVPSLASRAEALTPIIQKIACVTPAVIAKDLTPLILTKRGVTSFQQSVDTHQKDPFHEARMRLSIQFPDKRLLQYDCGKLQTLAKLLRKLQDGGHRALIFTQMTKVLDILEQFLNIHGYKYLRLDGSTKVEQRQILTDRFNNDKRILVFILSSRSGGLGINLTGADTVIFYDLDWNPAMDKQCQDRCHRIGQTRDVHIYRLVSEHTIEANILRKANQKRMLDDVVIQEGEFTTDYFNKASGPNVIDEDTSLLDGDAQANAAMDRVLGGPDNTKDVSKVLAQAEDKEDVAAARIAEREVVATDAADFDENAITASATPAMPGTPLDGLPTTGDATPALDTVQEDNDEDEDEVNAWGQKVQSTDDYMLKFMMEQVKDTPVEIPKEKGRNRKGRDHRSHRAR